MNNSFGVIRQLGFVVPDIDAAMSHWLSKLGVGPFFYIERQPLNDFAYRGLPSTPEFSVALAQAGPIQIELIRQLNDAPSAFKQFTDEGREGLQHVAYWTDEFDHLLQRVLTSGYELVQDGRSGSGAPNERFAYLDSGGPPGTIVEISEVCGRKRALFDAVADASHDWDGTDPVRDMSALVLA